jgi:hypothetical protein
MTGGAPHSEFYAEQWECRCGNIVGIPSTNRMLGLTPEQAGDYTDPMARMMAAPLLAHARRTGARLTPAQESVANEDKTEMREFRASQIPRRETRTNCPTCGAIVPSIFEHVDGCPE